MITIILEVCKKLGNWVKCATVILVKVLSLGMTASAIIEIVDTVFSFSVRKIYDLQMNIAVSGFAGRIHVTEVVDDFDPVGSIFCFEC